MPPTNESRPEKSLLQVVEEVGLYPIEAYDFVQQGLTHTVGKIHGPEAKPTRRGRGRATGSAGAQTASRHVDGRQLCEGLREYALLNWGLLARTVLGRWNITRTADFGRIVFALVENGYMQKTQDDSPDDFRDVYDFAVAFESSYKIEHVP